MTLTHPDDRVRNADLIRQIVEGQRDGFVVEKRYVAKGGRIVWSRVSIAALRNAEGQADRIVGVAEDVTELKTREEELAQSQKLLRIAGRTAKLGGWRLAVPNLNVTWSDETAAIHGEPDKRSSTFDECIAYFEPEFHEHIRRAVTRCASEGTPFVCEAAMTSRDGQRLWLRFIGEAVRDEAGQIVALQGACQDVSASREAEEEIHRLERRLATTLERLTDAFLILDRDWRLTYVNQEAERLLRKTRQELLGRSAWQVFPEVKGSIVESEYRRAVEQGVVASFEFYFHPFKTWFEVRAYPVHDGLAVYFKDVTEQHQSREALRQSEERFRLLSKATKDAIWDWDLVTNSVWWNDGVESLFGCPRTEVVSTDDWLSRVHPDDRQRIDADVRVALEADADSWSGEYRFRRKDGSYAWVLDRGHISRDQDGKAVRMIGGMTDLTERRLADEKLREQAALLDNAREAIIVNDMAGRIIFWNRGAQTTYGWTAAEAVGRNVSDVFCYDAEKVAEATKILLRSGEWQGELLKHTKDRRKIAVEARWTLVRGLDGQPKSIFRVDTDVTERRQLEAHLLRAQRTESIGTLAGGIAHDLNNVFAPIMLAVQMLRDFVKSDEAIGLLATLEGSAQRGADLVKQVLAFARGVEGKRIEVHPGRVFREVQAIIRDTFPKNIEFKLHAAGAVGTVTGDPTQLYQVLMNLCVNARDAMPAGGILTITAGSTVLDETYSSMHPDARPGNYMAIKVSDTGKGIPRDIRDRIFEPFFTTKEIGKGTGLGLSTTAAIVKSHAGFINVSSEVGKGSAFTVYLPLHSESMMDGGADLEKTRLPTGNNELVLVVDDEPAVRKVAQRTLERYGYRVITASNGAEGVSLYAQHQHQVAVVLTDMAMPIMDGPTMIVALATMNPCVRIIASSGLPPASAASKAVKAATQHFIPKPYTAEAMLTAMHAVLHERT